MHSVLASNPQPFWKQTMPPKLAAEKIAQRSADLRIYVEEHAARINQRSGRSLREKLDQRFSKEEHSWFIFLWKQEDKFTADHRQHLSDIFALVSTGTPTELIGGVNVRAGVFVWWIQANQRRTLENGPERQTREEAEADGQVCNDTGRGIEDVEEARTAVVQKLAELRGTVSPTEKQQIRDARKRIKTEQQDDDIKIKSEQQDDDIKIKSRAAR